ncbi:sugar-binding transcriptional regulator [Ornithinimicrobium cavernae]|uniref:sugar-binding transcriptional regulator n=1 Tax=Ornithinimicrobium cavernae TaxID=2666047 RepID=UPI00137B2E82|nr:sugar-binding transcriptional regulator [Ornithinimicrobium cavernae]
MGRLYYEEGLTQSEIALRVHRSRPSVSRLLTAARELGVVRIEVSVPLRQEEHIARALEQRFGLRSASVIVSGGRTGDALTPDLGRAGAEHLDALVEDGTVLGVSNGRTLAATAKALRARATDRVTVVQIIGALGSENFMIDGPDVTRAVASAYGGMCRYLHVPLLVPSAAIRENLTADPRVRRSLDAGRRADLAVVGVGSVHLTDSSPLFEGLRSEEDLESILAAGAVGHLCGEHLDHRGNPLDHPINERVIGIGLEGLRQIPMVIGVAGGAEKGPAILAALRGGYLDVLVTDDAAARYALSQTG